MKDTCKQAIFRKDTRRVRRAEDPLRAGDQEERELEFFNNIIRKDSTPKEKEDTVIDDPLEQMIERVPLTLTEVNDTIIKHHTSVTDN